jgi:hypothetical protein
VFEEGDVLFVTGSSLAGFSGRRFVYRAPRDGVPIAIIDRPDARRRWRCGQGRRRFGTVLPALANAPG